MQACAPSLTPDALRTIMGLAAMLRHGYVVEELPLPVAGHHAGQARPQYAKLIGMPPCGCATVPIGIP
jgi:hypothetical protein